MKMHSSKFKDPLISRAQPVAVILPLVEESLRSAGVSPNRDLILDYFMNAHPRIAVIHGGDDHPPNLGMKDTIRRVIRFIWASEALPFEMVQSFPCEELAHGTDAAQYALMARNLCAASVAAQMEVHGYDAAIVIGACDKMLVGNLRGLVESDYARQRRARRPVFAMVIPSLVGREARTTIEDRSRFEPLRVRMSESDRNELDDLLARPLKLDVYAAIKSLLDRCFHHRIIQDNEKDDLERVMARCAGIPGANCAASDASVSNRLIVASLGLVPRHCDIANKPVSDLHLSGPVKRLVSAVHKRERRVSVSGLIRSNLSNAAAVWSASGGHPSWILHLAYLANAVGKKLEVGDLMKRARQVPQILSIENANGNSAYAMSVEAENGGNSGIDTVMRTLSEKRWIEDRAVTLDGSWAHRITDARSANGVFIHSTMTPYSRTCGISEIHGNVCAGGVVRLGSNGSIADKFERFNRKVFLAVTYLGIRSLQADLNVRDGISERLKRKITRDDLYDSWKLNQGNGSAESAGFHHAPPEIATWNKARLWNYLAERGLLNIMVIVAGAGPHAAGMPEIQVAGNSGVVMTDGRVSLSHNGISIAHVVPEAFDGGPIGSIRTGDWIFLDLAKNELHVVRRKGRRAGIKIVSRKDLMNRPDRRKRVHEIARQRLELIPSFRILLDSVSTAESGVSPKVPV